LTVRIFLLLVSFFLISVSACDKKADDKTQIQNEKKQGGWRDNISVSDIPNYPVKGNFNGKIVQFQYINFEKWRGTNDNVINFSLVKPEQSCGFIENFSGFTLVHKGGAINQGEWVKGRFTDDPKNYQAFFKDGEQKSSLTWNCALNIESMNDKVVKGKIALFFDDDKKSWVAGKFEALVCNN